MSDYQGRTYYLQGSSYTVEKIIAEGGYGLVFQVQDHAGVRYALKRLAVNDQADLKLCKQEIAVMKAMGNHPHSVRFIASAINQLSADVSEVLILMNLVKGGQLLDIMNRRIGHGFDEQEVLKIFCHVCLAVTRLHHRTRPITHRDLKVENILLKDDGNYVLCDYGSCCLDTLIPEKMGVAQCEEQIKRFTTLAYRAPEMVDLYSGKPISVSSDIWALGCLLYKLCFFTTPFGEQTLAILSGTFTIPDNSPYSEELHRLIRYMLEPDVDKRPNIFQVCHIVHHLRGFDNPVPNVFNSPIPDLSEVPRPLRESESRQMNAPVKTKVIVPQVQTTSIIARERPRASTPNQCRSEQLPITASPQAPRRKLQHQGAVGVEQQQKPTKNVVVNKQQQQQQHHTHLQVQAYHKPQPIAQASETFDFNPRQEEKVTKPYVTPFDTHQGSEEVDLFGQQPFSSANGKIRPPSRENSHSPSPPIQTDAFGSVPFTGRPRETPSVRNGPLPSNTPSNKQLDQFGSEPFTSGQVTNKAHHKTASGSSHQYGEDSFSSSPPTDPFGHTPFVVTENKLFRQSDSFHSSSSSATSFSPTHQSISASCSEDLLISNRRANLQQMSREQIKQQYGVYPTVV